jgi:hypothetical protein
MEITTAVATDADAVAELHTASWRRAYATLFPAQYLDGPLLAERQQVWRARLAEPTPGAALFLAMETSVLLGFIYLEPQPDGRILLDNLHAAGWALGFSSMPWPGPPPRTPAKTSTWRSCRATPARSRSTNATEAAVPRPASAASTRDSSFPSSNTPGPPPSQRRRGRQHIAERAPAARRRR